MLTKFDDIIEVVLHHEGGYVNDPDDPGGETNFGIAKRSHPDVDIKNLTKGTRQPMCVPTKQLPNNKAEG